MKMREKVYLIGSHTLKTGKYMDKSYQELSQMTVDKVLEDAGLKREAIQSIHFANCGWPYFAERFQDVVGQLAMRYCGFQYTPVTNHSCGCSTGSLALHSAVKDILSGLYDCSMAVGVEKIHHPDKEKMLGFFYTGTHNETKEDFDRVMASFDHIKAMCKDVPIPEYDERNRSPFMDLYATVGLAHMQRFDVRFEDFAAIASKNHNNSQYNPLAQYQFPVTVEAAMNDYIVSYPLTRSMCAPMSDGAASAIVCSEEFFRSLPKEVQDRAVLIRGSVFISGHDFEVTELTPEVNLFGGSAVASKLAYEMAGIGPEDIDVCECHDASAIGELLQYEDLGFCPKGEGGRFAREGKSKIGGQVAVNTSGGLESCGHPIAATGLRMTYEIVTQLRGEAGKRQVENARFGMTENGGGMLGYEDATCAIHIFEKL